MRRSRHEVELELTALYSELERFRDQLDDLLESDDAENGEDERGQNDEGDAFFSQR